jgi:poly-gamma-glutamate capsule biosynthesis protein CapA/YwtB (metallophosphatase superfamily)
MALGQRNDGQLAHTMIDAAIGGHPQVTQVIQHYLGKPIICSVGNFVMKATDNNQPRIGWALRLQLDKLRVAALDARVARINMGGLAEALATRAPFQGNRT